LKKPLSGAAVVEGPTMLLVGSRYSAYVLRRLSTWWVFPALALRGPVFQDGCHYLNGRFCPIIFVVVDHGWPIEGFISFVPRWFIRMRLCLIVRFPT